MAPRVAAWETPSTTPPEPKLSETACRESLAGSRTLVTLLARVLRMPGSGRGLSVRAPRECADVDGALMYVMIL